METKRCSKCGRELPLSEFYKNKTTKDGASHWCKKCNKKHNRQYYASNKEKIAEKCRQYRADNKDRIAEKCRQYRADNKDRIAEYRRKYYSKNKERIAEKYRQYRADNKEQIADRYRKYRADNKDRIAERGRLYRAELPHAYIKGMLTIQHIPINETTIELQRNRVLLKRYIRKQSKNA